MLQKISLKFFGIISNTYGLKLKIISVLITSLKKAVDDILPQIKTKYTLTFT